MLVTLSLMCVQLHGIVHNISTSLCALVLLLSIEFPVFNAPQWCHLAGQCWGVPTIFLHNLNEHQRHVQC